MESSGPLTKSRLFWFFQTLIAVLFITRIFYVQIRFYQERLKSDPKLRRKLILKKASYALKSQNWEEFLSLASNLARELDQKNLFRVWRLSHFDHRSRQSIALQPLKNTYGFSRYFKGSLAKGRKGPRKPKLNKV